jgi:ribosomal protein S27E
MLRVQIVCESCGTVGAQTTGGKNKYAHHLRLDLKARGWKFLTVGMDFCPTCWAHETMPHKCPTCKQDRAPRACDIIRRFEGRHQ